MLFPGLPFEAIFLLKNPNFMIFFKTVLRGFYYVYCYKSHSRIPHQNNKLQVK